jgi:hypothetical protein
MKYMSRAIERGGQTKDDFEPRPIWTTPNDGHKGELKIVRIKLSIEPYEKGEVGGQGAQLILELVILFTFMIIGPSYIRRWRVLHALQSNLSKIALVVERCT